MVDITNWERLLNYTIDEYVKGNRNSSIVLDAIGEGVGQAFTSPQIIVPLSDMLFLIQRNAAFIAPGTVEARLYRVLAGTTVGTTAVPDIVAGPLATSDTVLAADIPLAWGEVLFHFATPYTLNPLQGYVIVIVVTNCPLAGQVEVGIDITVLATLHSPTHSGNQTDNTSILFPVWTPNPLNDVIFYLFSFNDILAGGLVDVSDRWGRQLGQVDISRYRGAAVGPLNPIDVNVAAIVPAGMNLIQVLGVALAAANPVITGIFDAAGNRMPSMDVAARPGFVDPIDRWARQLGLVDISRVLGAALTAANPVITGIYDAAANRMPSMDVAARPGFVDVIDRAARLLGVVRGGLAEIQQIANLAADGLTPGNVQTTGSFLHIYDSVGADWNRLREGAAIGQALVDVADRAGRLLGAVTVGAGSEEPFWLTSDKDTHFTEAIAENAEEDENLAGLGGNKIVITDVIFEGKENLHFRLLFWSKNTFEDTDLDVDTFLGFVDLDVPSNGFQKGAANQYYLNITDVNLHYEDEDASNELHVSLNCVTAAGKTAGVPGEVKIKIAYKVRE